MRKSIKIEERGEFNRQELLNILDSLKPGLFSKGITEQTTHYLFMEDRIATYNDELCLMVEYPIGFKGSVRAEEFYKLLAKSSAEKVSLDLKEEQLMVKAGKTSFGLAYTEEGQVHEKVRSLEQDSLKWKPLSKELKEAMVLCSFSASKDMTKPA
ncbi:hypothetical protein KKH23_08530, partial [Patescibacteria group bacterium]|nr:hypothetical protein [Patescibacteria group bacterium]